MKKKREWERNVKDLVKMKLMQKKRKPKKHKKEETSLASQSHPFFMELDFEAETF